MTRRGLLRTGLGLEPDASASSTARCGIANEVVAALREASLVAPRTTSPALDPETGETTCHSTEISALDQRKPWDRSRGSVVQETTRDKGEGLSTLEGARQSSREGVVAFHCSPERTARVHVWRRVGLTAGPVGVAWTLALAARPASPRGRAATPTESIWPIGRAPVTGVVSSGAAERLR